MESELVQLREEAEETWEGAQRGQAKARFLAGMEFAWELEAWEDCYPQVASLVPQVWATDP